MLCLLTLIFGPERVMAGDLEWISSLRAAPISLEKSHAHMRAHTHPQTTYLHVYTHMLMHTGTKLHKQIEWKNVQTQQSTLIAYTHTHALKSTTQTLKEIVFLCNSSVFLLRYLFQTERENWFCVMLVSKNISNSNIFNTDMISYKHPWSLLFLHIDR